MVSTPAFKWEWNPNTIAILVGFAAGFVAWGYTINDLWRGRETNARNIERLDLRLDRVDMELRSIPNHELRITANERSITAIIAESRDIAGKVNDLATDARVIREIVERIEASQRRTENGAKPTSFKP